MKGFADLGLKLELMKSMANLYGGDNTVTIELFSKWLLEKNPTLVLKDNGRNSTAVGTEIPDGHWHWIGYVYTIGRPATHLTVFTYFSGAFESVRIANPNSFETVHDQLISGPPQKCKACTERDKNANKAI